MYDNESNTIMSRNKLSQELNDCINKKNLLIQYLKLITVPFVDSMNTIHIYVDKDSSKLILGDNDMYCQFVFDAEGNFKNIKIGQ